MTMEEIDAINFRKDVLANLTALNNRVGALELANAPIGTIADADDAPAPLPEPDIQAAVAE